MPDFLVDASHLVALGYPRDRNHVLARQFAAANRAALQIPDVVLVEAIYNLQRLGGTPAAVRFSELLLKSSPRLIPLTEADFARVVAVMRAYRDAELEFVDCCRTALAERLNVTGICTFDRRDFSIIRSHHTEYFRILPED